MRSVSIFCQEGTEVPETHSRSWSEHLIILKFTHGIIKLTPVTRLFSRTFLGLFLHLPCAATGPTTVIVNTWDSHRQASNSLHVVFEGTGGFRGQDS